MKTTLIYRTLYKDSIELFVESSLYKSTRVLYREYGFFEGRTYKYTTLIYGICVCLCAKSTCGAVCCSALQCGAVCCSVLQCVAVWCSVLQCGAVCCSVLQCAAVCCSVLQCVAVCCNVLQCVATLT